VLATPLHFVLILLSGMSATILPMEDPADALIGAQNELVLTSVLREYERKYFFDVPEIDVLEVTDRGQGSACFVPSENRILIHPSVASYEKICRVLILHELIHSKLYKQYNDPDAEEGLRFQAEVKRLWNQGAYGRLL